jgi:hypothetical protein
MLGPDALDGEAADAYVDQFTDLMASDYRQTKGRRSR